MESEPLFKHSKAETLKAGAERGLWEAVLGLSLSFSLILTHLLCDLWQTQTTVLSEPQFPCVRWSGQCYREGHSGDFLRV